MRIPVVTSSPSHIATSHSLARPYR